MCLIIINKLTNEYIIMNESMSIFMATTILALGGLGLYMFKSSDQENQKGGNEEYNEDGFLSSGNFFGWGSDEETKSEKDGVELEEEEEIEEVVKPRRRSTKTQRNRKSSGLSKRRYY